MRRFLLALLIVASCTKTAMDDPSSAPPDASVTDAGPSVIDAMPTPVVDASDASVVGAGRCSDLPAYVCDFSAGLGSCNPLDGLGSHNGGMPGFVDDGGPDGSRAFYASMEQGPGGGSYTTAFRITIDGGAACNFVCDVDLRLATSDPASGTWVMHALPDFATAPSRLEIADGGWVHTGDDEPGAHTLPVSDDWFHARMSMTRLPNDAGATTTLTLTTLDGSMPSSTTQHVQEMPIGLRVGLVVPASASGKAYADNIVCRAVD